MTTNPYQPAGLVRRLAALFYDSMLLLALLFIATALLLPFTDGEATRPNNPFYAMYLLLISFFFYAWSWMHGGQTLGMRTWDLQLLPLNGNTITWWHLLLRFLVAMPSAAIFGLGYLWLLIDKDKLTWHDRYSETHIVVLPKKPRS